MVSYPTVSVHLRYVHEISLLRSRSHPTFPPFFLSTLDDDLFTLSVAKMEVMDCFYSSPRNGNWSVSTAPIADK